jgi:hypothetical protein
VDTKAAAGIAPGTVESRPGYHPSPEKPWRGGRRNAPARL